jgi:hypothetical protein
MALATSAATVTQSATKATWWKRDAVASGSGVSEASCQYRVGGPYLQHPQQVLTER